MLGTVLVTTVTLVGSFDHSTTEATTASRSAVTTTRLAPPATVRPLAALPGHAPVITRVETNDPVVFVTIDDGFSRGHETIDVATQLDIPLTLFLVDQPVLDDAVFFHSMPRAVVEGHSMSHPHLQGLPEEAQRAEICGNVDTVTVALGRRPVLFRPPYGEYDTATQRAAAACGITAVVLWEQTFQGGQMSFRSHQQLQPGDIVLLHFRPDLPGDLLMLVEQIEAAGLRVARLQDYLSPSA